MYSGIVYHSNTNAAAALTNIVPVNDPLVKVQGNFYFIPTGHGYILGGFAHGVTATLAQLRSPSIRMVFNQELQPLGGAAIPSTPSQLVDMFDTPVPVVETEPLEALIMAGAGAQHNTIGVFIGDGKVTPVVGEIRTIRCTTTVAAVADTWTNVPLNPQDTMPSGKYQLVGLLAMSTSMIMARALIAGQFARPAVIGSQTAQDFEIKRFRRGNVGLMGEFMADNLPSLDIFCNAADAAAVQFYWLDVIYMGKA